MEQDRYSQYWYRQLVDTVVEKIDAQNGQRILDMGTGPGIIPIKISENVGDEGKIVAVDASGKMIEKGKKKVKELNYENIEFIVSYIEDLNFKENSFDTVVTNLAIDHVEDKLALAKKVKKWLKPGGKFIVGLVFPVEDELEKMIEEKAEGNPKKVEKYKGTNEGLENETSKGYLEEHPEEYHKTVPEFKEILENAGFEDIEIIPPYAELFPGKACAIVISKNR